MSSIIDFVITARPSWSRVKNLIEEYAALEGNDALSITLIGSATSEKYGDIRGQMPLGITVDSFGTFEGNLNYSSVARTSILGAQALSYKWDAKRPDSVLVIADRTETLGVSLAAATMQIPLIHLQGGEISGSIDNKIRGANSKLADFHLTTNQITANNLSDQGEDLKNIRIIGCPSVDIVKKRMSAKVLLPNESSQYGGVGANFSTTNPFGVILFHPDTFKLSENIEWVNKIIELVDNSDLFWFWFWPNIDIGGEEIAKIMRIRREKAKFANVRFLKNISPEAFIDLAIKSAIMVGNSSFGIREASFIGLPVVNLGTRQFGRLRADNVTDIKSPEKLIDIVNTKYKKRFKSSTLYGDGNAAKLGAIELSKWEPKLKENT
jgi:UDP-hydrolysing UDP-N-acetyl-D-glucosamine 2-epimerase